MNQTNTNEEPSDYKTFMDLEEVAKYLKVSMSTIYRYINSEENPLPSFKLTKKHIVVKKDELDAWIEEYRKNGGEHD